MHREELQEVGKRIGRSKSANLAFLEHRLGRLRIQELDRGRLIQFGKEGAREGAGAVTSRLFEAGFSVEQVSLVTGHKDWKMLPRYTHLNPEALHNARARQAA